MSRPNLITNGAIHLFGTVMKDSWIYDDDTGYFSSLMLIDALSNFAGDVTVMVNCQGGDPEEGEAIRAALMAHPGKVTVKIAGAAHSAASLMIMGADDIEMSAGSTMLIHDPSADTYGNAAELLGVVEALNALADVYASVYAARTGKTAEEMRAIMVQGVTFTAQTALEAGLIDRITGLETVAAEMKAPEKTVHEAAMALSMSAFEAVLSAKRKFDLAGGDAAAPEPNGEAVNPGTTEALNSGELSMTKPNGAAPVVVAPIAAPDVQAITMQAQKDERARVKSIREMSAPFAAVMAAGVIDGLIDDGSSVDDARVVIMDAAALAQRSAPRAVITRDEGDTKIEGIVGALMHAAAPARHKLEGPSMEFRGMRLKSLAMHLGGTTVGFNQTDMVKSGMRSVAMTGGAHGVSDFSYLTAQVMNRLLRSQYDLAAHTWRQLSRQRSASDFRSLYSVSMGTDLALKPVGENGEYKSGTITDEASGLKVTKYGRDINLTFEAIINDDMGAFDRLPGEFARNASNLEASIMWELIRSNAVMADTIALFHADHGNLAGAAAISAASVGAGRKAMFEQRAPGSTDKDDFVQVIPDLLFVPPALEITALQFTAPITAAKNADSNPYSSTVTPVTEPRLGVAAGGSDSRWYLFSSALPPLEHAFLDGYEAPTITTKEGMNPDGVNMVARHIFGGAPVDFRGAYRNG
ncbi:ATP-dependent Clp protease proteolytic subunit [Falsihalocynthiibacter sp. CO-5D18]|uniref:Clp protease ClpP n=1 Tax=Falsihalocynthiibacter sp. CO-5D18 TaxID=3240872 RepID=UPI0035100698